MRLVALGLASMLGGMTEALHLTSGDCCGELLRHSDVPGEVFVWHDVLYDGPVRVPGWPSAEALAARANFLSAFTAGGLSVVEVESTLSQQYQVLKQRGERPLVLWFDACLFDMAMLVHVIARLADTNTAGVELLVVDAHPAVVPYDGLGQLSPVQLAACYPQRAPLGDDQVVYAQRVDAAFAQQDDAALQALAAEHDAPLPWVPAACARWLQERPDPLTGLGRLASLALAAIRSGHSAPGELMRAVFTADGHPVFWGDISLWAAINDLADRNVVQISGPAPRLPQWTEGVRVADFAITPQA